MDPFANGMCGAWTTTLAEQARDEMGPTASAHDRFMERGEVAIQTPQRSLVIGLLTAWRGRRQQQRQPVSLGL